MINIAKLEKKFNSLKKFNLVFASFFFSLMTLCVKNIDKRIPIYELVLFRSLISLIITLFIIKLKNDLNKTNSKIGILSSIFFTHKVIKLKKNEANTKLNLFNELNFFSNSSIFII